MFRSLETLLRLVHPPALGHSVARCAIVSVLIILVPAFGRNWLRFLGLAKNIETTVTIAAIPVTKSSKHGICGGICSTSGGPIRVIKHSQDFASGVLGVAT